MDGMQDQNIDPNLKFEQNEQNSQSNRSFESKVIQIVKNKRQGESPRKSSLQIKDLFKDQDIIGTEQNENIIQIKPSHRKLNTIELHKIINTKGSHRDLGKWLKQREQGLENAEEGQDQMMNDQNKDFEFKDANSVIFKNQFQLNQSVAQSVNDDFRSQQMLNSQPKKSILSRWKKLGNVFLSIHRLQTHEVKNIDSPQKLQAEMNSVIVSPLKKSSQIQYNGLKVLKANTNVFQEYVGEMRKSELFIMLAERGSDEDIEQMKHLLLNDPKRFLRQPNDPDYILNRYNKYGQNALYLASKNGNLNVIKFLIQNDSDPHKVSNVYTGVFESPLEVAVRWSHKDCIEWMLENIKYSNSELLSANKIATHQEIKNLFRPKVKKNIFQKCCS